LLKFSDKNNQALIKIIFCVDLGPNRAISPYLAPHKAFGVFCRKLSMDKDQFHLSREKHLDHMARVVPFIVMGYALHSYVLLKITPKGFGSQGLVFLGVMLAVMIAALIVYDVTHKVQFDKSTLTISMKWGQYQRVIHYPDIASIEVRDPGESFSTLIFRLQSGKKIRFYFVDDAQKIKEWIDEKKLTPLSRAA
jgi:hypothetical protein